MLKALHTRLFEKVSEAAGATPVVWAPYPGQRCEYPWVALQLLSGPDSRTTEWGTGQRYDLTAEVLPGTAGDTVNAYFGCLYVEVSHTGDPSTTAALLAERIECLSCFEVAQTGTEVLVTGDMLLHGRAIHGMTLTGTPTGAPVRFYESRQEYRFQVTVFATDPRAWAETGGLKLAKKIRECLYAFEGKAEQLYFVPDEVQTLIGFPSGKAEAVIQYVFEVEATFSEPIFHSDQTFDCVELDGRELRL